MFLKISSSASAFISIPQIKFRSPKVWFSPASVPSSPSLKLGALDLLCFLKFITCIILAFSHLWILQAFGRGMDRSVEATILGPVWYHPCVHAVHTCSWGCEPPSQTHVLKPCVQKHHLGTVLSVHSQAHSLQEVRCQRPEVETRNPCLSQVPTWFWCWSTFCEMLSLG